MSRNGPLVAASLLTGVLLTTGLLAAPESNRGNDARARAAFARAYPVFLHARCQNCHPAADSPLQGDDSHVHNLFRLRRGADGNGVFAMRCGNCHQASNGAGPHTPPGAPQAAVGGPPAAPRWHLPSPESPMVFEGRAPGELCRQLQDPAQNGGLTPERFIHHVTTDPLVLWAWDPGEGRTSPPLSHREFVAAVTEWLDAGGECPP